MMMVTHAVASIDDAQQVFFDFSFDRIADMGNDDGINPRHLVPRNHHATSVSDLRALL